jgi:predicted transcriptional regulator
LSQADLAEAAGVSLETVKRLEVMVGDLKTRLETLTRIKIALEKAGVEFISENGAGAGVRLAKRRKK